MGKADLHIHSEYSDGMASVSQILEYVQDKTDLDLIAIADHDTLEGSLDARALVAEGKYRFEVMVGMEVTTREGHLLAYDIQEPIPMLQPLDKVLAMVQEQGGFCIAPHPMSWLIFSLSESNIRRLSAPQPGEMGLLGIEVLSATPAGWVAHERAKWANQEEFHLAELGGSDAHFLEFIGKGYTEFPGHTPEDFRRALREKKTLAAGSFPTLQEQGGIIPRAIPQFWRSLILLPGRHLRRAWNALRQDRER
ncbi:MAG: PHP domain-containing protein [Chloroflexi bacterium]|nr:PHP domain-containing protein [Chloroflexota bacterium]